MWLRSEKRYFVLQEGFFGDGEPSSYIKPKLSTYKGVAVFSSKSPKPFIAVLVIFIIAFIVAMIATGGQGFEGHWKFEF